MLKMVLAAALAASAQGSPPVYQANGFFVYREDQSCALYADTPAGTMIRISYTAAAGNVFFSAVRSTWPALKSGFQLMVEFDDSRRVTVIPVAPYGIDDGRNGFSGQASTDFLDEFARGRTLILRADLQGGAPIERFNLVGSGAAIAQLRRCATSASEAAIPPAPPGPGSGGDAAPALETATAQGELAALCQAGRVTLTLGRRPVYRGAECSGFVGPSIERGVRLADGGAIFAVDTGDGAAQAGSGLVVRVPPSGAPTVVGIDYMTEFTGIVPPNRFRYAASGVMANGMEYWICEITVDWARGRISAARRVDGRAGSCGR